MYNIKLIYLKTTAGGSHVKTLAGSHVKNLAVSHVKNRAQHSLGHMSNPRPGHMSKTAPNTRWVTCQKPWPGHMSKTAPNTRPGHMSNSREMTERSSEWRPALRDGTSCDARPT